MDVCSLNQLVRGTLDLLGQTHGPLVPDLLLRVVAPDGNVHLLTLAGEERFFDGEVHGEPRMHAWGVLLGVGAVEDVLVELSGEVAPETMDLAEVLLHCEAHAIILLHARALTLSISLNLCAHLSVLRLDVWQVPERKDLLSLITTGEGRRKDTDHIRQLKGVQLL